jgi:hypothetical protein
MGRLTRVQRGCSIDYEVGRDSMVMTIDHDALVRTIRRDDFSSGSASAFARLKHELATRALAVVDAGFANIELDSLKVRNKTAYRVTSLPEVVVLRRLNTIIRVASRARSYNRNLIVRQLTTILREGVPHRVYKFDIKSFYDSVDSASLVAHLSTDPRIPRQVAIVLENFFEELNRRAISGLPRGVALSATLAEYLMQPFDAYASKLPEVYYYARFVDDIIMITDAHESTKRFLRSIRRELPSTLCFSHSKTGTKDLPVKRKHNEPVPCFDYLGYRFLVHDCTQEKGKRKRLARKVEVAIAPRKICRLKTRVGCAVADFITSGELSLLQRRLQLLTGNYTARNKSTGKPMNVGLYCNYRRATSYDGLHELDGFLHSVLVGNRSRLSKKLATKLTLKQRQRLLVFSFASAFEQKIFYNFSGDDIFALRRCWQNA